MRSFWPVCEPAQADYETLREGALVGVVPATLSSVLFNRAGLAGLIVAPLSSVDAVFVAQFHSGRRPAWHPYDDPRRELLADAFGLLVHVAENSTRLCSDAAEDGA